MIRVLLLIPDNPFDPTNGAARSVRTICEMLAKEPDFEVRCLAPGYDAQLYRGIEYFRALYRGIEYFRETDILFTYGCTPTDRARRDQARQHGCKVVFALRNSNYKEHGLLEPMDGIITPSQWLTDQYRKIGIESTPLPLPMNLEDVVSTSHGPYVTAINISSAAKGHYLMLTLAEEMRRRRPDIPFGFVRPSSPWVQLPSCFYVNSITFPRDIFAQTKILLVPSVYDEPGGRVAVEALLNGIPPIVSDRGALPEVVNGAGFVVHIPKEITVETNQPVPVEAVKPWIDVIERLWDDKVFYKDASRVASDSAAMYRPEVLAPRYVEYFRARK
jgi:glycosyltransferase involved in cell wall biosynthesis